MVKPSKTFITDMVHNLYFVSFFLVLALPVVCVVGLVTNSITVYVVSHKSNRKELKEKQYDYMRLNALVNALVLLIQMTTLINECQGSFGLFCSSIRFSKFLQFYRMLVAEYASNCLRLVSNLTYVAFALNRQSLVGRAHGSLITYVSELTISEFLVRISLPCLILPVVKAFRFYPNSILPEQEYPTQLSYYFNKIPASLVFVYLSFNSLFDLINYVGFLIVNFALDVMLAIKMKKTLDEKEKNQSRNALKNKNS